MMQRSLWYLGLLAMLGIASAQAANQEIRASFAPNPSQPNKNVFTNNTPNSGYCADYPGECAENNMFSIQLPIRFQSSRAIMPGDGVSLKVPANWRQLTVTNAETQEMETVEVRITGGGFTYVLSDTAANLVGVTDILEGHQKLWTSNSWVYAPAPCQYSGVGALGPRYYRFFWKTPVEADCTKVAAFRIPSMYFETLNFAYELRTPNPLGMSGGRYTGSLSYSLGMGRDFEMKPLMVPDDDILTLDFVLDVDHTLKVDIPPGGEKVQLAPAGGWQSWLYAGRKPVRLFRDQTFNISSTSSFKMFLECSSSVGRVCRLSDPGNSVFVPLKVSVSLPNGLTDMFGKPVQRQELTTVTSGVTFQSTQFVDRKPGTLHFELEDFNHIFTPGAPKQYSGNVVVVWDSEI